MGDTSTNVSVPDSASSPYQGVSTPNQVTDDQGNGSTDTPLSSQQPIQPAPNTQPVQQSQQPGQEAQTTQPAQAGQPSTPGSKSVQQPQTPGQSTPATPPNPQLAAAKQKASAFNEFSIIKR